MSALTPNQLITAIINYLRNNGITPKQYFVRLQGYGEFYPYWIVKVNGKSYALLYTARDIDTVRLTNQIYPKLKDYKELVNKLKKLHTCIIPTVEISSRQHFVYLSVGSEKTEFYDPKKTYVLSYPEEGFKIFNKTFKKRDNQPQGLFDNENCGYYVFDEIINEILGVRVGKLEEIQSTAENFYNNITAPLFLPNTKSYLEICDNKNFNETFFNEIELLKEALNQTLNEENYIDKEDVNPAGTQSRKTSHLLTQEIFKNFQEKRKEFFNPLLEKADQFYQLSSKEKYQNELLSFWDKNTDANLGCAFLPHFKETSYLSIQTRKNGNGFPRLQPYEKPIQDYINQYPNSVLAIIQKINAILDHINSFYFIIERFNNTEAKSINEQVISNLLSDIDQLKYWQDLFLFTCRSKSKIYENEQRKLSKKSVPSLNGKKSYYYPITKKDLLSFSDDQLCTLCIHEVSIEGSKIIETIAKDSKLYENVIERFKSDLYDGLPEEKNRDFFIKLLNEKQSDANEDENEIHIEGEGDSFLSNEDNEDDTNNETTTDSEINNTTSTQPETSADTPKEPNQDFYSQLQCSLEKKYQSNGDPFYCEEKIESNIRRKISNYKSFQKDNSEELFILAYYNNDISIEDLYNNMAVKMDNEDKKNEILNLIKEIVSQQKWKENGVGFFSKTPAGINDMRKKENQTLITYKQIIKNRQSKWVIRKECTKEFYCLINLVKTNDNPEILKKIFQAFCDKWNFGKTINFNQTLSI